MTYLLGETLCTRISAHVVLALIFGRCFATWAFTYNINTILFGRYIAREYNYSFWTVTASTMQSAFLARLLIFYFSFFTFFFLLLFTRLIAEWILLSIKILSQIIQVIIEFLFNYNTPKYLQSIVSLNSQIEFNILILCSGTLVFIHTFNL